MALDGSIGHEDSKDSLLASVSRTITPVFAPMGIEQDNWPATVGIFTGIFAKEAVVGTLDAIYLQNESGAKLAAGEETAAFSLSAALVEAVQTIPENLVGIAETLTDPLGLNIGDTSSAETAAAAQAVSTGTFGAMGKLFDGQIGAIAYMLFILMYFPCVAAMAAVYRETNRRWTLFIAGWTTGLAYLAATGFYQLATFARHPGFSTAWLAGSALIAILVVLVMRAMGRESRVRGRVVPAGN